MAADFAGGSDLSQRPSDLSQEGGRREGREAVGAASPRLEPWRRAGPYSCVGGGRISRSPLTRSVREQLIAICDIGDEAVEERSLRLRFRHAELLLLAQAGEQQLRLLPSFGRLVCDTQRLVVESGEARRGREGPSGVHSRKHLLRE